MISRGLIAAIAICSVSSGSIRAQDANLPSPPQPQHKYTPVHLDPNYPLKVGGLYYPKESRKAREQGVCQVRMTVTADGLVKDLEIVKSTGYARLDEACLEAFRDEHLFPGTEDGVPVETKVTIPITWKLTH